MKVTDADLWAVANSNVILRTVNNEISVAERLDVLLEHGYYRYAQSMGTEPYPCVWLRANAEIYTPCKEHRRLARRFAHLSPDVTAGQIIDPEIQELYTHYRSHISFSATTFSTVKEYLLGSADDNFFITLTFRLRHQEKLVAASYLDMGNTSSAAILNFYHPDYSGLGKYLYFKGLQHTQQLGRKYFYPGYFMLNNQKMDYKLDAGLGVLGAFDFFRNLWLPFREHPEILKSGRYQ